ncbi:MAG: RagB/SusD family nutrient uptake outer membrane protein [Dysgonomonas sp.]
MKKYINTLIVSILLISLSSCEDFLDEKPYSFASGSSFYTSAVNAELGLTGVYSVLNCATIQEQCNQPLWGRGMHYLMMHGDEIVGDFINISDPSHKEIASMSYNSESTFVGEAWFALYAGIDRANNIIKYVPSIEMDETRKNQIIAEAHFFRGFYHLYLTWLFGGVPIITEPSDVSLKPRSSVEDVYAFILSDLKYAYNILPDRNPELGRVNKWTAAGFMVKVYTYLAACKQNNVGESLDFQLNSFAWVNDVDYYQKAENLADTIIANSSYKMTNPVYNCFLADTKTEQKNECLMITQSGAGGSSNYYLFPYLTGPQGVVGTDGGNYGWMRPIGELSDKYNSQDSRFYWNLQGNTGGVTASQTINGSKYFRPNTVNSSGSNLCLTKFRQSDPLLRSALGMPTWASNIDYPILRLSDIILLCAEAKYKNGNEAGARVLLESIRERACTNGTTIDYVTLNTLNSVYHKSDFMEELMDERSRELCGEGWRRLDLIRMGKFISTIRNLKTTAQTGNVYYYYNDRVKTVVDNVGTNDKKIWYPIPKREIAVNPNLVPNPQY